MPSTHTSLHFHIIFSTKDRHPFIADAWRARSHEYLGGLVHGANGIPRLLAARRTGVIVATGAKSKEFRAKIAKIAK